MKSIKKEYTAPKAEVIEFECEDILLASGLIDKKYTKVGTKSWFEALGGSATSSQNVDDWGSGIGQ